jgi:hypothetical protein
MTTLDPITLPDLTQATLEGTGVFDTLMRANKAHLESEFTKGRIKGPEYATVYLGSLEPVLQASLQFLLQKDKNKLEADLIAQQILLAQVEIQKAQAELAILQLNLTKIPAEIALLGAQKDLVTQQALNAVEEGKVLIAQECKLKAEFDVLMETKLKTVEEKQLLLWKTTTEKAQTLALGVDNDSVIGKQKALYGAQTDGFVRDAEQKAAKLLADSWNVRRTTDENILADPAGLGDANIARAINKLLTGVGA